MHPINYVCPTYVTEKVEETRDFYVKHFDLTVTFDCGWYVSLRTKKSEFGVFEIAFRKPEGGEPVFKGGSSLALGVKSADDEHARLRAAGVPVVQELSSKPWGDRSFVVVDPSGVGLYVFHPIEVSPEFRQYQKA